MLTDNLVAYWKFEGNSNDSVGSNNGTDTAITYNASYGKIGQGALLNGTSSFISVADATPLKPNNISISVWFNASTFTFGRRIMGKWDGANGFILLNGEAGGNNAKFYLKVGSTLYSITGSTALSTSTWYHLVVTHDGSNIKMYLNGSSNATAVGASGNITHSTINLLVGNAESNGQYYGGDLDEIGIWSRALTSTEVTTLYNGGAGLQYPFSTGSSNFFQLF